MKSSNSCLAEGADYKLSSLLSARVAMDHPLGSDKLPLPRQTRGVGYGERSIIQSEPGTPALDRKAIAGRKT